MAASIHKENDFSSVLFHTVPGHDLDELSDCEKGAIIATHYALSTERKKGKPSIKIDRTTCDNSGDERTIVDIINDDIPFLVDSVVAEINRHKILIDFLIHPYIYVEFNDKGTIGSFFKEESSDSIRQSHIHIRLHRLISRAQEEEIRQGILKIIDDVKRATRDWKTMRKNIWECRKHIRNRAGKVGPKKQDYLEYADFLEYLYNHNFTLLGYRYFIQNYQNDVYQGGGKRSLGLLQASRNPDFLKPYEKDVTELFKKLQEDTQPLHVFKINRESTVHRRVPIDVITVQQRNDQGQVIGFHLFIGLFTSVTYSRSVTDIPYLRMKIEKVIDQAGYPEGSHDDKALQHILEKYPRDELFQINTHRLHKNAQSILSLQERQRIALFLRPDLIGRTVACMVYIPRERFDTRMRIRFQKLLEEEIEGTTSAFYTTLDDSVFARVLLLIEADSENIRKLDESALENKLRVAGRAWDEMLSELFNTQLGNAADNYVETYCGAFPVAYRERYPVEWALRDIEKIEKLFNGAPVELDLYKPENYPENQLRLKIFLKGKPVTLSDVLPILENMGLKVIAELPFEIKPHRLDETVWIHDFQMEADRQDRALRMGDIKRLFEESFRMIWLRHMESDHLNRLVLGAVMSWREIIILRTYVHYLRQIGFPYSRSYVAQALSAHPKIVRQLVDLFRARHDPEKAAQGEMYAAGCTVAIDHELEFVESLDQDRILRTLATLIEATLRTNFFQRTESGDYKDYLSIKLESQKIKDMPDPKPYREIFVYAPRVEGIHLRGGPIARGGIRWSDRIEDYRTEVLGLMKAQMVKNAVIVPVGAKGGFIVKNPPQQGGRQAFQQEGIACYCLFIRGMLDITDNRKGTQVIPPRNVVRRDGDDPYLVVAADKGTATFSDYANTLSNEYGFWLRDAFASGGSAGYDHKDMGITARGAWESVKRHFRELNHDTQTQPFDVIGCGDMGGDVFGNGMLLSDQIRLIGAFNHLHIFCDPDPDPETSFKERQRLFDQVKGWDEYDTSKLSTGGRIFSRSEKGLTLTPEIQQRFNIPQERVSPFELIRAMLRARANLLWFGGIGTYIKSAKESHADVGDKTNDPLRVNADELQSKVIGEGANLAVTQLGRIEFAQNGGCVNADFIDNSGGVDTSDHEVNIKILLQEAMNKSKTKLSFQARNKLLESMTSDVGRLVLYNNEQQAQAISLMEYSSAKKIGIQAEFITDLERELGLNRKLEGLPEADDIQQREREGKGLSRPELSILQAYAKITLTEDLLASNLPDLEETEQWLYRYFPPLLHKDYSNEIRKHRLKRQIIATNMANSITNRMGATFIKSRILKTGASCDQVVRAYLIVREIFDLSETWHNIGSQNFDALAMVRLRALNDLSNLAHQAVTWFLKHPQYKMNLTKNIDMFHPCVKVLNEKLPKLLTPDLRVSIETQKQIYTNDGFPDDLAHYLSLLPVLNAAQDIICIYQNPKNKCPLELIAKLYFLIGESFSFRWLHQKADHIKTEDRWSTEAKEGLIEQLYAAQAGLTEQVMKDMRQRLDNTTDSDIHEDFLNIWMRDYAPEARKISQLFDEFRISGSFDLSMLSLAEQRLRALYER